MNRNEAYTKAFEKQKAALSKRTAEYNKAINELTESNTEFAALTRELSALGAKTGTVALSGNKKAFDELLTKMSSLTERRREFLHKAGIEEVKYTCDKCRDTGYISGKICDCIKSEAKKLLIDELSCELPLENCRFEDFDLSYYPSASDGTGPKKRMTQLFKLCREYAINFNPRTSANLLFMGDAGLGKTHLSLAIVSELLNKGFDVIYGSSYNLFSAMENDHFSDRNNNSYTSAVSCDLLVIDDLGSEFISPYIQTMLYNVINTRLLAKKPTIISTNLNMKEIEQRYTPRISSRLIGNYTAKKFLGNDIRQIKMSEKNS